jgi:hypothetical protein
MGQMDNSWKEFWVVGFLGEAQRRGVGVSPLKIGSRDGI